MSDSRALLLVSSLCFVAACSTSESNETDAGVTDLGMNDGSLSRDMASSETGVDMSTPTDMSEPVDMTTTSDGGALLGDTCATAIALTEGTTRTEQSTVGYTNDYSGGTGCRGDSGRDRVYSITVPAGRVLTATVLSDAEYDLSINLKLLSTCGSVDTACLSSSDFGDTGESDLVRYHNTSDSAVNIAIVVDNFDSDDLGGSFSITAAFSDPRDGDTCEAPATFESPSGGVFEMETTVGYINDYTASDSSSCTLMDGADRVYRVEVPSAQTLSVTVTPSGEWDPVVNVIVGEATLCAPLDAVCAATVDGGSSGDPESLTYMNSSGASQTAFIIVDGFDASEGEYAISVSIGTPGS